MDRIYWEIPLRSEWLPGHITIVTKARRAVVMQVAVNSDVRGDYARMLKVARRIVGLHNREVRSITLALKRNSATHQVAIHA